MSSKRSRFNWQAIHAELDRRLARLGSTIDDDPPRVDRLLRERSAALAAARRDQQAAQQRLTRIIVFRSGEQRYAMALQRAREVCGMPRSASLPGAGRHVVGIINWRGEFVVVFDLAPLVGQDTGGDAATRRAIVLRGERTPMALAVDAVEGIVQADLATLQGREHLSLRHAELFRGATADGVLVLAEDRLMARLSEELEAA